jgi:hypothetical protein
MAQAGHPEVHTSGSGSGGHSMKLTRAVTPIRLCAVNDAKVAALDGWPLGTSRCVSSM